MEIMDKYVQTGEALAEKENEVVQLTNQVHSAFYPFRTKTSSALVNKGLLRDASHNFHQQVSLFCLFSYSSTSERSPCIWSLRARSTVESPAIVPRERCARTVSGLAALCHEVFVLHRWSLSPPNNVECFSKSRPPGVSPLPWATKVLFGFGSREDQRN